MNTSKATARLAQVLSKRMHSTAAYHETVYNEQGVIISGHKLKIETLGVTVPRSGYRKARGLTVFVGDHVLVNWASGDPVIVAKL